MGISALAPYLIPGVVAVVVAWLGLKPKQEPASLVMTKNFESLSNELAKERESRIAYEARTNERITQLSKDVERLWQNTVVLKRHIVNLETELCEHDLPVPARPDEVQAIFS